MNIRVVFLLIVGIAVLGVCPGVCAKRQKKSVYVNKDPEDEWLEKWNKISERYLTDKKFRAAVSEANEVYQKQEEMIANGDDPRGPPLEVTPIPFTCDVSLGISPTVPNTVHELRPGDITVIGALGDSITAGNGVGANEVLGVIFENRGESWSVGGDFTLEENVTTIANMLRKFRPDLKGASECVSQETNFRYAWYNQARPGAKADDMPRGAQRMLDFMVNDTRVNMAVDWKMVTLFIGGNDFCAWCEDPDYHSPANYVDWIRQALDLLHANMPRTFVNLVPMADVSPVHSVYFHVNGTDYPGEPEWEGLYPWLCEIAHQGFCPCIMTEEGRADLLQVQQDYFFGLKDLVDSGRYDTKDDFTVVLQPHLKDQVAMVDPITGLTDNRYFSPDCFHPNRRMHQLFAYMLYNVMLTPVGKKPYEAGPEDWPDYLCPTEEQPYLFTVENSPGMTSRAAQPNMAAITIVTMGVLSSLLTRRQ